jgi:hypothetical protein
MKNIGVLFGFLFGLTGLTPDDLMDASELPRDEADELLIRRMNERGQHKEGAEASRQGEKGGGEVPD